MGRECVYSFDHLYEAAHGRQMTDSEKDWLWKASQDERNEAVAKWAQTAGWETSTRTGTDGLIYLAFCPSFGGNE